MTTPEQRIAQLEAEVARLNRVIEDQARAMREHAEREAAESAKREARRRVNQQNYERRKAAKAVQTSDSDRIQTLNQTPPSSPLCPPSPSPEPSPSSPLYPPFSPETTLSARADRSPGEDLPDATEDAQPVLFPVDNAPTETPEDLQALWNEVTTHPLPRWQGMSEARKRQAKARLRERPLADWRRVFERVNASAFCRGENDRGWRADPEFILRPDSADRVLEGKYDRTGAPNRIPDVRRGVVRAETQRHSEVIGEVKI